MYQQIDMLTLASVNNYNEGMATESTRLVHSDEKRHKCLRCGSVRYEGFMRKPVWGEITASSQYGNDLKQWICRKNCREE